MVTTMSHIHTSIISRHLASKGNNKLLRTPPPHISSSEQILHRLTRPTIAQLRTTNLPFSDHTYIKSTPNNIPHHYAPYTTPTHTTDSIYSTASTYAPLCHQIILGQAPLEWLSSWLDGDMRWLVDQKLDDLAPPTSKGQGSG